MPAILVAGILLLLFISDNRQGPALSIAFYTPLATFLASIFLWIQSDKLTTTPQLVHKLGWIPLASVEVYAGIDGISLFFILLTTFLTPLRILISRNPAKAYIKEYTTCSPSSELLLILVFRVSDLVPPHISPESISTPTSITIGIRGSRERKIGAAYQSSPYTSVGSLSPPPATSAIHFETGTTDVQILLTTQSPPHRQTLSWLAFLAPLAAKVPMIPVHTRPPEAHVEAPTAGSVILAGVSSKSGGHGPPRSSIPMFPEASVFLTPSIHVMSVVAVTHISPTTSRQADPKKIIAHPSVAHTAFVTLGIFTYNSQAIEGSISSMLSHGVVSSASSMCVGVLYDRHKTRIIKYYSGSIQVMPVPMTISPILTSANSSLPTTGGFAGESLVIVGSSQSNKTITLLAPTGMVLGAAYPI
jgi:proton-translocating NADH-quinone oxidoreductase chain M